MVDHYSDFFEVDPVGGNTYAVIRAMKRQFARHEIPDECISNNGTQFESREYSRFAREYGFIVRKSSLSYHSRGNGKAESALKISKNILKKSRHEDPYLAFLAYRNTPQQGYDYSPAQRLMSRRLRDIIPTAPLQLAPHTVPPSLIQENISERRRRSEGDRVYVKPRPTRKHQPCIYGEVIGRTAPRSCLVSSAMGPVRRNHAQIREAKAEPVDNYDGRLDRFETASLPSKSGPIEETDQPIEQEPTPPPRRSTRERRLSYGLNILASV